MLSRTLWTGVLRGIIGGATMTIPGGSGIFPKVTYCVASVLGPPVSLIGPGAPRLLLGGDPLKVKVGKEYPDGTFEGEEVEFEGREVGVWEGPWPSLDPNDQFLVTNRLYECPDGYRVHEAIWSASGHPTGLTLYPVVGNLGHGTYTDQEARKKWGKFFEAL